MVDYIKFIINPLLILIEFYFIKTLVEMAGMGFGSLTGAVGGGLGGQAAGSANAMHHLNQFMLQNLQTLIAANPNFLTGGIPNKLLSQMWIEPTKVMQSFNVSEVFVFFFCFFFYYFV